MLSRLFPPQLDNVYRGYRLAIWLLVPLALVKLVIGGNTMINTRFVIENADQIPLASYGAEAGQLVVFLFQAWGLSLALMSLLALIACMRYRAMVPLAYLMLLVENTGRKVFGLLQPVHNVPEGAGLSLGTMINVGFIAALLIGFALSMGAREEG